MTSPAHVRGLSLSAQIRCCRSQSHIRSHTHTLSSITRDAAHGQRKVSLSSPHPHTHTLSIAFTIHPHTQPSSERDACARLLCVHCRTPTHCPRPATPATSLPPVAWRPRDLGSLSSAVPTASLRKEKVSTFIADCTANDATLRLLWALLRQLRELQHS